MLDALSFTSVGVTVGAPWMLRVLARTATLEPSGVVPDVLVVEPGGSTAAPVMVAAPAAGVFYAEYTPAAPGRHVASVTSTDGAVDFLAEAVEATAEDDMPDAAAYTARYGPHSDSDQLVEDVMGQERAAQMRVCRVPAAYPADLRGALLRRTNRALAMLALPLAVRESSEGENAILLPGRDPEVRRLEGPWRRIGIG